jgi:hypothetical protein
MNFIDKPTVGTSYHRQDTFNESLIDAAQYFAESNIQMVSGVQEILFEEALFSEYTSRLCEGMSADEAMALEQLLYNTRHQILKESTVSQVTPITGLSMPIIRKMWIKTALKNAIPTEVAKKPVFTIAWIEPYLRDAQGKKTALPQAHQGSRKFLNLKEVPMPKHGELAYLEVGKTHNLIALAQAVHGVEKRDAIDPVAHITGVVAGGKVYPVRIKLSIHSGFYGRVEIEGAIIQLFGNLDCETGEFTVTAVGGEVEGVQLDAKLTAENNARTDSVSYDVRTKDVRIGTKAHINAELPIEWLNDNMALYNIDGTVECVDLMSNVVAQRLDVEILDFLYASDEAQGRPFEGHFSVRPTAGFAGSPTEWRAELRTTIEWWANRVKSYNAANFSSGHFVILGNPIDIQLIPDIQWQFQSATQERAGVSVKYSFGVITASNVFQVVSTEQMESGELFVFFVPDQANAMTYKYYPYTFNIEKGYISPNEPYVPSIMMTKRHTIEELMPCAFRIVIEHNDGQIVSSYRL